MAIGIAPDIQSVGKRQMTQEHISFTTLDLMEIERQARATRARAIADMFAAIRRSMSARLHRGEGLKAA